MTFFTNIPKNEKGSILTIAITTLAILSTISVILFNTVSNAQKSAQHFQSYTLKKQLELQISSQYLINSDQCKCQFSGASPFSGSGANTLGGGPFPTEIAIYELPTPGDCSSKVLRKTIINQTPQYGGLFVTGISLKNISPGASGFNGEFEVSVQQAHPTLGPHQFNIQIPVSVSAVLIGPNLYDFTGCQIL